MKIPAVHNPRRGQTTLEYLLLLAVVAVVVIASFSRNALLDQVHNSAQGYFNTVTTVVMGKNPTPVAGGWCPVTCPSGSGPATIYGACECPAPAFGGAFCPGVGKSSSCGAGKTCPGAYEISCSSVTPCGPCPTGEVCNAQGVCGCADGLDCSAITNASPNGTCTSCDCNAGTFWNGTGCAYCPEGETYNGTTCVAIQCPPNMYFDTTSGDPGFNTCQCFAGAYYVSQTEGCAYCPACQTFNGTGCVAVYCGPNMYCDSSMPPSEECQCISGTSWNGTGCSPGGACTLGTGCVNKSCGPDSCPNANGCGTCPSGETCNSSGQCEQIICVPKPACPASNGCGTDNCGNICGNNDGNCPDGQLCSGVNGGLGTCNCDPQTGTCIVPSSSPCDNTLGYNSVCRNICIGNRNACPMNGATQESCVNGQCICGTCNLPVGEECGNSGEDNCGNPCTIAPSIACPTGTTCTNGWCTCVPNGSCNLVTQAGVECGNSGEDNCGNPCTLSTPVGCPTGTTCTNGWCTCVPNGSCNLVTQAGVECGSSGEDNCDTPCTLSSPVDCPSGTTCKNGWCYCTPTTACPSSNGCSTDSCNNVCGENGGGCPAGDICNSSTPGVPGTCQPCTTPGVCPSGAVCGADTCGNPNGCGTCPAGKECSAGQCCSPTKSCAGSTCGIDSCGAPCGTCPSGQVCNTNSGPGTCVCSPATACPTSNGCGTDSCGNVCGSNGGSCPSGQSCSSSTSGVPGTCTCTPDCTGKKCGDDDSCGGKCQSPIGCHAGQTCYQGACCTSNPPCASSACGTDNCGNACGPNGGGCPSGQTCNSSGSPGSCVCAPNCAGKNCGDSDGCTGRCSNGYCPFPNTCGGGGTPNQCGCTPNCTGCGAPDGCGGTCGSGDCPGAGSCVSTSDGYACEETFTLTITNYAACSTCKPACDFLLGGGSPSCGTGADCGTNCSYSACSEDPSGVGYDCGSCLSETVSSGTTCPDGIAYVIPGGQTILSQTQGSCAAGDITPGTATIQYTVVCNP